IWSHHHILMDGWCIGVLIREFMESYRSLLRGEVPEWKAPRSYAEYIQWLDGVDREGTRSYWREYLKGYKTVSCVPRRSVNGDGDYRGCERRWKIGRAERQGMRRLCEELGVTESSWIQVVWGIVLSRYNN